MNKKAEKATFVAVINRYGLKHQFRKLQEESGELIAAVNHHLEGRRNGTKHLHQEFADVEIMMDQLRPFLDNQELAKAREDKLKRLAKRLNLTKGKKTNGK